MSEDRDQSPDFNRALSEARKQAASVGNEVSEAAQAVYGQTVESASRVADEVNRATRRTSGSFERALRNTIETQPYTAVGIALALGWLLGRMHRPF